MATLRKPLSVVLGLMAAAVLFHFVFGPFYEDALDSDSVWTVLNLFMALGIVLALAITYLHKKDTGPDADTNAFICVNVAFYAAATLAILFFWNWFDDLTVGEEGQSQTRRFFWVFINTLFVILLGTPERPPLEGQRPHMTQTPLKIAVALAALALLLSVAALVVAVMALNSDATATQESEPTKEEPGAYTKAVVEDAIRRYERDGLRTSPSNTSTASTASTASGTSSSSTATATQSPTTTTSSGTATPACAWTPPATSTVTICSAPPRTAAG